MPLAGLSKVRINALRQEIEILQHLDHPNVIRIHETYEEHGMLYVLTELCTGGELFNLIEQTEQGRRITEENVAYVIASIIGCVVVQTCMQC